MCVEELFCPLATHFWRVLLKYVRKYCVTSWYLVGYIGNLWRLWKQKVQNCCNVRVRVRARKPVLTSSSSQFSAFLYVSSPLYYLLSLNACTVGCHNRLTPQHRFAPLEYEFSELRRKMSDFYSKKLRRFTENLGDFSKNVGELFWILRLFWCAIPHISLLRLFIAPPLLLKSKSSLRAFAPQLWPKLGNYGELWGNSPFLLSHSREKSSFVAM